MSGVFKINHNASFEEASPKKTIRKQNKKHKTNKTTMNADNAHAYN